MAKHPAVTFGFRTHAPENHLKLLAQGEDDGAASAALERVVEVVIDRSPGIPAAARTASSGEGNGSPVPLWASGSITLAQVPGDAMTPDRGRPRWAGRGDHVAAKNSVLRGLGLGLLLTRQHPDAVGLQLEEQ